MSEYAVFWGCYIPSRLPNIEASTRLIFRELGVGLKDIKDVSCCPDPLVSKLVSRDLWIILAARNLCMAESMGLNVMTVCNGCFETLFDANEILMKDANARDKVNKVLSGLGVEYKGNCKVRHFVEVLYEDVGISKISSRVVKQLEDLKVAVHYGCHMFREKEGVDVWRKPSMFRELVRATGSTIVDYGIERMCCGYPARQVDERFSLISRLEAKLKRIENAGADCIVIVCPTCCIQFEAGQTQLKALGMFHKVPIIHLSELMALSMGIGHEEFGLDMHKSPTSLIVEKLGLRRT